MMPDKWKNGINAIIALFTQSQNEFLIKHVSEIEKRMKPLKFVSFLAGKSTFNRVEYSDDSTRRS